MFFAFRLVTRRETFLPHPLLFLNLPLMSSYWSSLDDLSKIVIWTVSTNKDPMERHNWGEISKVFAKMFEHVKTIIPRKIPMKSSKKTQTVGELISFSPGSRLKYLSCGRSWVLLARVRPQDSAFNGHRAPSSLSPTQGTCGRQKLTKCYQCLKKCCYTKSYVRRRNSHENETKHCQ